MWPTNSQARAKISTAGLDRAPTVVREGPVMDAELSSILHAMRNRLGVLLGQAEVALIDDEGRALAKIREHVRDLSGLIHALESALVPCGPTMPSLRHPALAPTSPSRDALDTWIDPTLQEGEPRSSVPLSANALVGVIVDNCYRIEAELGRGAMGTVLQAHDLSLDRSVALKLLHVDRWGTENAREVFRREARAMARVRHPNVVSIYAFGAFEQRPYFAMELVEGTDLERFLRDAEGSVDVDDALAILDQACRGVTAIHEHGAVHRDLKPSNILLGPVFRVLVADLGVTANAGATETASSRSGTPGYMAPEVIALTAPADARADVYALGVVARELFGGRRAFRGDDVPTILENQLIGAVTEPTEDAAFPAELMAVVGRAMALDPDHRYQDVETFRCALHDARQALSRDYADKTVMVVDDNAEVLAEMTRIITRALPGASIHSFPSAEAALAQMGDLHPQLALVDLEMPSVNGVELTALLQADPVHAPAVVVVTGVGGARDWRLLQRIGASGFMLKPVDPAALGALARKLLRAPAPIAAPAPNA